MQKAEDQPESYDIIVAETAIEMRNFVLAPDDSPDDEEVDDYA